MNETITVSVVVKGDIPRVWTAWTEPEALTHWCFASADWECPHATSDLREGGKFLTRMQAKDGSVGFDLTGTYTTVVPHERISYTMDGDDARKVDVTFHETPEGIRIDETFAIEHENPREMQRAGWQSILEHFKTYVERA